jgi:Nucleoside 2-deoxyribosyltransferase like
MNNLKYINWGKKINPIKKKIGKEMLTIMKRYAISGSIRWNEIRLIQVGMKIYAIRSVSVSPYNQVMVEIGLYDKNSPPSSFPSVYVDILNQDIPTMISFYESLYNKVAEMLLDRNMGKVFLGGSCGDTTWRADLIPYLEKNEIEYFNPVVEDWNDEAFKKEQEEKTYAATLLFVLSPRTENLYSIAEMVNLIRDERRVIVVFVENDGDKSIDPFSKIAFSNIQKDMKKYKSAIFASFKSFNDEAIEFIINQINQ